MAFGAVLDWVVGGGAGSRLVWAVDEFLFEVVLDEGDGHSVLAGFAEVAVAVAVVEAGAGGVVDEVAALGGDAVKDVWPAGVLAEDVIFEEVVDGGLPDADVFFEADHGDLGELVFEVGVALVMGGMHNLEEAELFRCIL